MKNYLLIDCNWLCWRAFYTTGGFKHDGVGTGVAYGVLRDLELLADRFGCDVCFLAFDYGGGGLRQQVYPEYKANRHTDLTEEQKATLDDFRSQIKALRSVHLPGMGYKNVHFIKGYEGDDLIAAAAARIAQEDLGQAVIVTADNDLWQCLSPTVCWHNPTAKKTVTFESFRQEWGIDPSLWAHVKALAGCSGDNVEGVRGIGEATAAKWYAGTLKSGSKKYMTICANLYTHNRNLPVVRLPYPGLNLPPFMEDEVTEQSKNKVLIDLGIKVRRKVVKAKPSFSPVIKGFDA